MNNLNKLNCNIYSTVDIILFGVYSGRPLTAETAVAMLAKCLVVCDQHIIKLLWQLPRVELHVQINTEQDTGQCIYLLKYLSAMCNETC